MPQYFPLTSHKYPQYFPWVFSPFFLHNPHQLPAAQLPPYRWSRCPKPVPLIEKSVPKPGLGMGLLESPGEKTKINPRYIDLYIVGISSLWCIYVCIYVYIHYIVYMANFLGDPKDMQCLAIVSGVSTYNTVG